MLMLVVSWKFQVISNLVIFLVDQAMSNIIWWSNRVNPLRNFVLKYQRFIPCSEFLCFLYIYATRDWFSMVAFYISSFTKIWVFKEEKKTWIQPRHIRHCNIIRIVWLVNTGKILWITMFIARRGPAQDT